ncbi:MAG: hypothetical protein AAF732_06840 [Pseudomonadota bacterium]
MLDPANAILVGSGTAISARARKLDNAMVDREAERIRIDSEKALKLLVFNLGCGSAVVANEQDAGVMVSGVRARHIGVPAFNTLGHAKIAKKIERAVNARRRDASALCF